MENLKNLVAKAKNLGIKSKVAITTACVMGVGSVQAFAVDEPVVSTPQIDWSSMGSAVNSNFNAAATALIPVGVGIFAFMLGIGFGPKIIKKFTGR